jgi:hypothetical protein
LVNGRGLFHNELLIVPVVPVVPIVPAVSIPLSGQRLERLEPLERVELNSLLSRFPDFHNPLLHFFLFGSHPRIAIGKDIFFSRHAPLLGYDLADGNIGTERLSIDSWN